MQLQDLSTQKQDATLFDTDQKSSSQIEIMLSEANVSSFQMLGFRMSSLNLQNFLLKKRVDTVLKEVSIILYGFIDITEPLEQFILSQSCSSLKTLDLSGSLFQGRLIDAMSQSETLQKLEKLVFESAFKVSCESWANLFLSRNCSQITYLDLTGCSIDENAAETFALSVNTNKLQYLSFSRCPRFTDMALRKFFLLSTKQKSVQIINLSYIAFGIQTAEIIRQSDLGKQIQRISIEGSDFPQQAAASLLDNESLPNLIELDMIYTSISHLTMISLSKNPMKNLKSLSFDYNDRISSQDFDMMIRSSFFQNIEYLDVGNTRFNDSNLLSLLSFRAGQLQLKSLIFYFCTELTHIQLLKFFQSQLFTLQIQKLNCASTSINNECAEVIIQGYTLFTETLKELIMYLCQGISNQLKAELSTIFHKQNDFFLQI